MVNALFDHSSSSGSSGSTVDAIQVSAGVASLSTEEFDIIDTSDSGIVMSVSRTDGVDINADTTIHTPVAGMVPLLISYRFQQQRGGTSESRQYDPIRGCHEHSLCVQYGIRYKSVHRSEQVDHELCS